MKLDENDSSISGAKYLTRILGGCVVLLCFSSVIFVMTMLQMGNRMDVLTQLFNTTRGTETMFYSEVLNPELLFQNEKKSSLLTLEQGFVMRYIEERVILIPDTNEMFRRWNPSGNLARMSYGKTFIPAYKNSDERLKNMDGVDPRHAENIRIISRVEHFWTAEYDVCYETKDLEARCSSKRVNISVAFIPSRRDRRAYEGRYFNPLGMVVTDWQETDL